MKALKFLYRVKEFYIRLFHYPRESINLTDSLDYDDYWRDKRGSSIGELSSWQKDRADFVLSIIKGETGDAVVLGDIGCGDGSILNYLQKKMSAPTRLFGYDSSMFALSKAKEFGIETRYLDISTSASYLHIEEADYFLILETLEHITNSELLLSSTLTKSRRGVFFSFPNTGFITHRLRLLFGKFPLQWRLLPNEHVRFWTWADLKWWLSALRITNYEIHGYKGVPILNKIIPSLFAAGIIVYLKKDESFI